MKKINLKKMAKKVLIVIPVYNGVAEFLRDCLDSLAKIDSSAEVYDVLCIDDCSKDNSAGFIRQNWPGIKVLENQENLGFAKSNNVGLNYAISEGYQYVYLLNQDTVVRPDFLDKALRVITSDSNIGAVQSKLMLFSDKEKINSWGNEIHFLGFAYAGGYKRPNAELPVKEIAYPSGAACLVKVSALSDVGLFNEEFYMYHEDVDLGWRLWLSGYRCLLAPESVVYHKYDFSRSIKKLYYMERNRYLAVMQNYRTATILLIMPAMAAMDLMMFVYSFYAGWWRQELDVYKYFFKSRSMNLIAKTRRQVQSKRRVPDKKIISHFTGKIEFQDLDNPVLHYLVNPVFNLYWQIIKRIIWW